MTAGTSAPELGRSLLYLTEEDVTLAAPPASAIADAIADAVRAGEAGDIRQHPKARLMTDGTATFFIMPAVVRGGLAGIKWLGGGDDNAARGLPTYSGLVILSDATTGLPLAIIGASQLTAMRTAALSLLAARALTPPDADTLGLVGAGAQAESHFAAFREAFPIRRVLVCSAGESARRFAERHRGSGIDMRVADAAEVIGESTLIVSAVGPAASPFLDGGLTAPGSFVAMADLGRAWRPETMARFDRIYTDDRESTVARSAFMPQMAAATYAGEAADLVSERVRPTGPDERTAFLFAGTPIADLALAMLLYERATDLALGRVLPI